MKGKSPMMKALVGKQGNLPAELKAKILASPATMKIPPTKKNGLSSAERTQNFRDLANKTKTVSSTTNVGNKVVNAKKMLGKASKFLGSRAFATAGMMMGTMGTADANPESSKSMTMKQEKDLVKRVRNMKKAPTKMKKESSMKMKKKSSIKMMKKSPAKKINPFSAEYKKMTVSQRKKKYGEDYKTKIKGGGKKDLTVANVKESLGNLNKKIKTGASKVSNVISPKKQDGTPQQKKITTKGGKIKLENTTRSKKTKSTTNTTLNTSNSNEFKAVTFKGKKGDPYSYRTTKGGGYEYSKDGKTFTKASGKGAEAISKIAPTKMKKKSSMKMMKKK